MPTFHEAREDILASGNTHKLDQFLAEATPAEAAAPFLGQWPSFNGIIAQTPIAHRVLTLEVLTSIDQATLNNTLVEAVRSVCFEGNANQGFEVLDRLVAAGARMDVMQRWEAPLRDDDAAMVSAATGSHPPRLDEQLPTDEARKDYVNRLVAADAAIYGKTISRDGPSNASQWARSLQANPLVPREGHAAFQAERRERGGIPAPPKR
jgi:hypothetical protein